MKCLANICKMVSAKQAPPAWISDILKRREYRADIFSASLVGKDAGIAALNYFLQESENVAADPVYHPSIGQRLVALGKM